MSEDDRQGHEFGALTGGVAKHHPLVPSPTCIDTYGYVGRLLIDRGNDRARLVVEAIAGVYVADVADRLARDGRDIDVRAGGDLAGDECQARGHHAFGCDPGAGILLDDRVEDRIRDLVCDFVRVAFGDAFRCEEASSRQVPLLPHVTVPTTGRRLTPATCV